MSGSFSKAKFLARAHSTLSLKRLSLFLFSDDDEEEGVEGKEGSWSGMHGKRGERRQRTEHLN